VLHSLFVIPENLKEFVGFQAQQQNPLVLNIVKPIPANEQTKTMNSPGKNEIFFLNSMILTKFPCI
jgi:hypothetical protein